jgi:hypothetical protein
MERARGGSGVKVFQRGDCLLDSRTSLLVGGHICSLLLDHHTPYGRLGINDKRSVFKIEAERDESTTAPSFVLPEAVV